MTRSSNATLGQIVESAREIYVSACAAEIPGVDRLLRKHPPTGATVTGIFSPLVNRRSYADPEIGLRVRSFFINRQLREHMADGWVDYCPWRYSAVQQWISAPGRFDTALVMLSPPDADGKCSLGVQADFLPAFYERVERIVGFINPQMPRTTGDTRIDYASLAAVVDCDSQLPSILSKGPDAAVQPIARTIAGLVRDGATIQCGIGQIPSQVLAELRDHRGLRVHTGIVDDNVLLLRANGALQAGVPIVTGTAIGTQALYDAIRESNDFEMRSVAYTHSYDNVTKLKGFTAINSVLQMDLLGQMSAEGSGGEIVASPGGLPDFVRGALGSDGGRSIIGVRARGVVPHAKGIVPFLGATTPATLPAGDADVIVTEFGVAQVRHMTVDQRVEAIIGISAPEDRDFLAHEWSRLRARLVGAGSAATVRVKHAV